MDVNIERKKMSNYPNVLPDILSSVKNVDYTRYYIGYVCQGGISKYFRNIENI